jgi:hypothetical protein
MKCECGQYGMLIATLLDGTHIYLCISCGKVWAERLVTFEVTFQLVEVVGNGHEASPEPAPEPVMAEAFSS